MVNTTDIVTLKNYIATSIVDELSDYFDSNSVYQYVPDFDDVTQDPVAIIRTSRQEGTWVSTAESRRNFSIDIDILVEQGSRGPEDATNVLDEILDALLDDITQDPTLGSNALGLEIPPLTEAARTQQGGKEYLISTITVTAFTYYDFTT